MFPYGEGNDMVTVYCECNEEDEGWTVIQKRFDGSVDFNRNWTDYKNGFGDACGEYWLGNEVLHQLSTNNEYFLKVILTDWNNVTKYVKYDKFMLAKEADGNKLKLEDGDADPYDSLLIHDGYHFSTGDRDNDDNVNLNLAVRYSGGWWYSDGLHSNLNGLYYPSPDNPNHDGIIWYNSFGYASLKATTMMIQRTEK